MKNELKETPGALVEGGRIHYGIFDSPFRCVNPDKATQYSVAHPLRRLAYKQWIGFGIIHPEWHITFFMVNAGYVSTANFYAYNRSSGKVVEHVRFRPGGVCRIAANSYNGISEYAGPGFRIKYTSCVDQGYFLIEAEIKRAGRMPAVKAEVRLSEQLDKTQPLVASLPLKDGRHMFTHKALQPVSGDMSIGDEDITFDASRDFALMDEHRSHLQRRITWKWATFAGYDPMGRLVGLNLGDHDTISDQRKWSENCLWIDERLMTLGPVKFELDRKKYMEPWKIKELDGCAEFTFIPEGDKKVDLEALILGMKYFQPCGRFEGFFVDDSGERIEVDNFFGVAEMMNARW